jgi:hypothetical protein
MGRNILAFGRRAISGKFGRVMCAGDISINNGDIKSLYSAGDVDIADSRIKKLRCAGDVTAINSVFEDFKGAGYVYLKGMSKADVVVAVGELEAEFLECNILRNFSKNKKTKINGLSKVIEWKGDFKAKTFENLCSFVLSCKYDFENIISSNLLTCQDELTCENLYSFDTIEAETINAENVFIVPRVNSKVDSVLGSTIRISRTFKPDQRFRSILKTVNYRSFKSNDEIMSLTSIEGDTINIEATNAELVSGMDVIIGDLCIIERVEYSNAIRISEKAIVNEVVKI